MNRVTFTIYDCEFCPNAVVKTDKETAKENMYCETPRSLIMLREGWGSRLIPDWCPCMLRNIEEKQKKRRLVRCHGGLNEK